MIISSLDIVDLLMVFMYNAEVGMVNARIGYWRMCIYVGN